MMYFEWLSNFKYRQRNKVDKKLKKRLLYDGKGDDSIGKLQNGYGHIHMCYTSEFTAKSLIKSKALV